MNEPTVSKMKQMKLYGMHNAFKTAIESGRTDHYTLDQFVSMLIDAEWDERHNRRIERSIKNAKFHYKSSIESVNFDDTRNLDRNLVMRLAGCEFVEKNENILITGSIESTIKMFSISLNRKTISFRILSKCRNNFLFLRL